MTEGGARKVLFSGIQPSGGIHLGNYLGAIRRWAELQDKYDSIFCVVDLHALTVYQDPAQLRSRTVETAAILIAAGIDPARSRVFVQSHVSAHAELAWLLECVTPVGWLRRMTQYKDKAADEVSVSAGLFNYPVLMASDILLYHAQVVPVGEDQVQHLELARDLAQRFNSIYGETFTLPEAIVGGAGSRVMGLDDPTRKMSKSVERPGHAIFVLDSADEIRSKISAATTDSFREVRFDEARPGIHNLLVLYELFTGLARQDIEAKFEGKGYAFLKRELAEVIISALRPLRERYEHLQREPGLIESVLAQGERAVRPRAESTLAEVKERMGLVRDFS